MTSHDPVFEQALDEMGISERAIMQKQERIIIRLRAALLTLGKTPQEITVIAGDQD